MENKQIVVAADNCLRTSRQRQFQIFVVLWIATVGYPYRVRIGLKNVSDTQVYNAAVQLQDQGRLNFIYQEERSDGRQSNFFRLESPDREDG